MGAKSILVVAGVAIATLAYLVYLGATYEPPEGTTTIVIPPPDPQPVQPEPEQPASMQRPSIPSEPEPEEVPTEQIPEPVPTSPESVSDLEEPVDESGPEPQEDSIPNEVVQLPALGNSDAFITERLRQIGNGGALLRHLMDEQLIRRFVVLVDNVSRGDLQQNNPPYREVDGDFAVQSIDDNLFELDEAGYRRFDQAVNALVAVDTEQAMMLYRLASPLFQQAFAELGYGDVSFDDTLRRAIRNVLATDDIAGPLQLVKPSVMYLYADSEIEGLSDVQKQMIRIGPDNREKVKAKLRQVLQQL